MTPQFGTVTRAWKAKAARVPSIHRFGASANGHPNQSEEVHRELDITHVIQQDQLLLNLRLGYLVHTKAENSEKRLPVRTRTRTCPAAAQVQDPEIRPYLEPLRERPQLVVHRQPARVTQMEAGLRGVPTVNHVNERQQSALLMQAPRTISLIGPTLISVDLVAYYAMEHWRKSG